MMRFSDYDRYEETAPMCFHCGGECSGDTTEFIEEDVDGMLLRGEFAICDAPDDCLANRTTFTQLDSGVVKASKAMRYDKGMTVAEATEAWEAHLRYIGHE